MESLRNGDGTSCSDRETVYDYEAAQQLADMLSELRAFMDEPYASVLSLDLNFRDISARHDRLLAESHKELPQP